MPEDAADLPTIQPDLAWLAQQQGLSPGNLVLAHDLGLAHYWQARASHEREVALDHWQRAVANWAMVLDNDVFWRDWAKERGDVYRWSITEQELTTVKNRLIQILLDHIAQFEGSRSQGAKPYLMAAFVLERMALRLLKLYGGLRLAAPAGERLLCGPLLVRQLGLESAVNAFFLAQPARRQDREASLETMLRPIQGQPGEPAVGATHTERECMLAFSGLGLAMVCLRRGEAEAALELVAQQQCSACHPELCKPSALGSPLERCREGCARFAQANPSYALVATHIALADQMLAAGELKKALTHGRQALNASQRLGVQETLRSELGKHLLAWAEKLAQADYYDAAIELLSNVSDFDSSGTWRIKLSSCLNLRGVHHANEGRWEEGLADLRRACTLNPMVPLYRENLVKALREAAARARLVDNARASELEAERDRVKEGGQPNVVNAPEQQAGDQVAPQQGRKDVSPPPQPVLDPPELFETTGVLDTSRFDPETLQQFIELACENAVKAQRVVLDLSDLVQALSSLPDSQLRRMLAEQEGALDRLCGSAQTSPSDEPANWRIEQKKPSVFDLWIGVLDVLRRSWIARADAGKKAIGEEHLLYGLATSRYAVAWMQAAHVALPPEHTLWHWLKQEPSHE